ncbi:MAG: sulfotransferase [Acidobacteria bacterium]|nr:sulfotransferase [Acidobacteriota bacterium]
METGRDVRTPNFFVVGASRSGTTSLWQYLAAHPDVFLPGGDMSAKEPSYYCDLKPRWAAPYDTLDAYLKLFAPAKAERAVGEASTAYLVAPESPGRLRRAYPGARIVIVLRNPADRAYSLYRYLCLLGVEWIPTFERALEAEEARRKDVRFRAENAFWYYAYLYFTTGLYAGQVARYLAEFPRAQVHVLLCDDLYRDPVTTCQEVYRFLGVDAGFRPHTERYYNESQFPLSVGVQYRLGRVWSRHPMHAVVKNDRRTALRRKLFLLNARLGAWRPRRFAPETRARLMAGYRQDIERTSGLIGRPLDHWLDGGGVGRGA